MGEIPKTVPLSRRIIVLASLFTAIAVIIGYGIVFILQTPILMEDDQPVPPVMQGIVVVVCTVVEAGILWLIGPIWRRLITRRGAMTLTEEGITDTFVVITVLAFWTTLPIKCIPWKALRSLDEPEGIYQVDTSRLPPDCGRLTALCLKIIGYAPFVGKISHTELEEYRVRYGE